MTKYKGDLVSWILLWLTLTLFFALVQQNSAAPKMIHQSQWFSPRYSQSATYLFPSLPDIIEAWSDLCIKTFRTLLRVRLSLWISSQLHIFCTSAVKRFCAKNSSSPFTCRLFSGIPEFVEVKSHTTDHWVARTSFSLISYSGALGDQKCIVKRPKTLISWSTFWYTVEQEAINRVLEQLPKMVLMVCGICGMHAEFLLTYWCS